MLTRLWLVVLWFTAAAVAEDDRAATMAPLNDNFAAAAEVSGVTFQPVADLGAATREEFEPYAPPAFGRTAWWTWVAPDDGVYEWDSQLSANFVAVTVYRVDTFGQLISEATTYYRPMPDPAGSFQATRGTRYMIQLDLTDARLPWIIVVPNPVVLPHLVSVSFRKSTTPAPANDSFAARVEITGSNAVFAADLSAATSERDEPDIAPGVLRRTLWWTWQAPDYGSAIIRRRGTNEPPVVGVYTRGGLNALSLVKSSATEFGNECYREPGARDSVRWDTTPAGRYEIQVDRFPRFVASEPAELELVFVPAPTNDTPAGAMTLDGLELSLTVSNTGATKNPGEFNMPTQSGSNSVWFHWIAPSAGVLQAGSTPPLRYDDPSYVPGGTTGGVIVTTHGPPCGSPLVDLHPPPFFVPVFGLYEHDRLHAGQPPGPTFFLCYGTNGLIADVNSGGDYWIQLDGDQDSSGETPLNLLLIKPPANDAFTNRILLPSSPVEVKGRTFAATYEATDPLPLTTNDRLERSVWWEWRAPTAGRWTFFVVTGFWENQFDLYRGATPSNLNEVNSTRRKPILFECVAGETFQIGVFAWNDLGGNVDFTLTPVEPPALRLASVSDYSGASQRWVRVLVPDNSGLAYILDQSQDLGLWTPVLTNANAWSHPLDVQTLPGLPQQFFRTRLVNPEAR